MVQELYDKRVLHRLLCVKPKATEIYDMDEARRPKPRAQESASSGKKNSDVVESAWNITSRNEAEYGHKKRRRRYSSGLEDEGGRYDIGRQSLQKRSRKGAGTVYVAYDDEGSDQDKLEEGEYSRKSEVNSHVVQQARENTDRKRLYWLAKAASFGGGKNDYA